MMNIDKHLVRSAAVFVAAISLISGANAQSAVTGSFAPPTVAASASSTLSLLYTGFTSTSTGMNLQVYYNSTVVTPGTVAYNSPPGQSQPAAAATAGTLASCPGADTFITLNWVDFGGTWPTPTAGTLATIPFTTAAGFTAATSVCWVDDLSQGAPARSITGSAALSPTAVVTNTAPTVGPLTATTLTGGTGTVPITVATAGSGTGSLGLNCTVPANTASITVGAGATRTIAAPATLGANAPAVSLTCTPQAAAVTATLSCAQTALPAPNPAALETVITCPAAPVAGTPAVTAVTPAGAVTLPGYAPGAAPGSSSTALNFNVTGGAGALSCAAVGTGYTAIPNPLNLTVGTPGAVTVTYTGTAAGTFTGTLTCTSTAPATGGPFVYNLSTTVAAGPVVVAPVNVPTMSTLGLALMGLLVAGFAGFTQRRQLGGK
jgi:hypothetical protein